MTPNKYYTRPQAGHGMINSCYCESKNHSICMNKWDYKKKKKKA